MKIKKEYKEAIIATLKCYNLLPAHIEELNNKLKEIKLNDGVNGIDYSGDGIKTNNINKLVENTALQNIEGIEEIKKEILLSQNKLDRLNAAIASLDLIEKQIVVYKYVNGYQWSEIVEDVNYSIRMCKYKLTEAIDKLAYIFYKERAFILDKSKVI